MEHSTNEKINFVLIRGLSRQIGHWLDFPQQLQSEFPDSYIYRLELPGVGLKSHMICPLTINGFLKNLRPEFLEVKNTIGGKWVFIAISMGGMISMQWAGEHPEDMDGLIVMNSSESTTSVTKRLSPEMMKVIGKLFFHNDIREREKEILKMTVNKREIDEELIDRMVAVSEPHPISRASFVGQLMAASRFQIPKKINVPLLFLNSTQDKIVSPNCSRVLSQHFGAPLETNADTGHDIPLDDHKWVLSRIKDFTAQNFQ